MLLKVCLIIFRTLTVISFVLTCSEETIIAKLSHVNKNKGVADKGPLIGHWDGWCPFQSKSRHSCGATEVSVLNMPKIDRCSTDQVHVVGFVPCYKVPKQRPCALDPFLEPLIKDLEDSFIKGNKVN